MKNINKLEDFILTDNQKTYLNFIFESNEASVFPDVTQRKLLEIIDEMAFKLIEYELRYETQ